VSAAILAAQRKRANSGFADYVFGLDAALLSVEAKRTNPRFHPEAPSRPRKLRLDRPHLLAQKRSSPWSKQVQGFASSLAGRGKWLIPLCSRPVPRIPLHPPPRSHLLPYTATGRTAIVLLQRAGPSTALDDIRGAGRFLGQACVALVAKLKIQPVRSSAAIVVRHLRIFVQNAVPTIQQVNVFAESAARHSGGLRLLQQRNSTLRRFA
jgi:hypothetical protein